MRSTLNGWLDRPVCGSIELDWEKVLYLTMILVALATRVWGLGVRVQSHDESLHTKYSWNLYAGQGFQHTPLMHGPFLFHATAVSYFLFGDSDFTARLVVALIGVAVVAFPYLFRRWLGRAGALLASFFLLISPSIAYYSRYIRHDLPVILWALIVVLAVFSYLRDGHRRWLYLMAAGISLSFATKEVAFIYNAIIGFFLIGVFAWRAMAQHWGDKERLKSLLGIGLVVLAVGLLIVGVGAISAGDVGEGEAGSLPWWGLAGAGLALAGAGSAVATLMVGTWEDLRDYRSFDLIIVLGTLCLPFLSPIPIKLAGLDPVDYGTPTIYYSGAIAGVVLAISAAIGLAWHWRRWTVAAAIHYAIFVVLFTTVFTHGGGIASGLVGSMGYWLAQQGVKRGSQPWYYYGVVVPLYDYLPLLLTVVTAGALALRSARGAPPQPAEGRSRDRGPRTRPLFVGFLLWWVVSAWALYSYAGEKMPWLTVHLALPMILLGAWAVGRFIERTNWREIATRRTWMVALMAVPLTMATGALVYSAISGPFQGSTLAQLTVTGQFLGSLLAVVALGAGAIHVARRSTWQQSVRVLLLAALVVPVLMTIRHAWHFCYVNYGYPIEHLVYAHSAPAVKETMRQIEELSRRVAGGPEVIEVAYGPDGSWPFHWYLRNYDNAVFYGEEPTREQVDAPVVIAGREQWEAVAPFMANDYIVNKYTYLWWPMEDYKNLSWQRIREGLADPKMRAALWRIWYDRDYRLYDEVTGKTHTLDEWPLRSEYRLYIRRDTVAKMWARGTVAPGELVEAQPYAENHVELEARAVIGGQGSGQGQFQSPRGVALGDDGSLFVADGGNHRIQIFSSDGQFMDSWGGRSLSEEETGAARGFNEPWDVAIGPDGRAYVADTWNHRVQKLDAQGSPMAAWGVFGESSVEDEEAGQGLFYGPRGIAVGSPEGAEPEGQLVYVTDTGNKRVQVFRQHGEFAFQFGGGGPSEGELDEPVGIALGPEGQVYVADTWNRRIQVFDERGGFLRQWSIQGWDSSIPEEKPYVAVDRAGHVYVTDPGYYRVLVFDSEGNYLLSFGDYGTDLKSFALPQGIAVAGDGSVYVSDAHNHRVLVFDPIDFEGLDD